MQGWTTSSLEELTDKDSPITYGVVKPGPEGDVPFVRGGDLEFGRVKVKQLRTISSDVSDQYRRTKLRGGELLVSLVGTPGQVAIAPPSLAGANIARQVGLIRLIPKMDKRYACYFLQSPQGIEALGSETSGSVQLVINLKALRQVRVPIPTTEEQKRIVAILDQAFADIDQARALTEQNRKNARELFESYMQQVFSQRGEGWSQRTLGELGKVSMCKRILKKQTSESGDIPFYKIGTFGKEPDAFINKEIYDDFRAKYSFPKRGDVLISASGTIGRRVIYDGEPAYFQDSNIVWIDNDESTVLNDYLYHFYGICDWNPSKGATISRLYNDDLRAIEISFPNFELQKKYIHEISVLNHQANDLQSLYERKLTALDELKKSLLQKAFSGELTKDKQEAA